MEELHGTAPRRALQDIHPILTAVVYFGLYFLGGMLGSWGSFKPDDFSAFWPPSGLCLAVLLLHRTRVWPVFFVATLAGSLLVERFIHHHGFLIGLAFGTANFVQGAIGSWLIKRITGPDFTLSRVRHVICLALVIPFATMFSAGIGILCAWVAFDWFVISKQWFLWWLADVVGILVVTPVVLAWVTRMEQKVKMDWRRVLEGAVLFAMFLVASDIVFGPNRPRYFDVTFPFPYILLPFLLWGAIRFEPHIAATASLLLAVIAAVYTVYDCGPFNLERYSQSGHALILQVFMGVAALFSLFPGPVISERRRALERISDLNETLERRVKDRTFALEESEQRYRSLADEQELRVKERTLELSVLNEELKGAILVRENITHMLEESTAMQRAILDSANASIISTEPDGTIRTVNATAERWLKYHGKELIGVCNLSVLHDSSEIRTRAELLGRQTGRSVTPDFGVLVANAKSGAMDESEWFYIRKDGSHMPVSLSVTALHDEKGAITGYLHIARDITERKQAEKALHESESNLRSFFNSASIMMGIVEIVDNDMVHISDNAASARFFGMTPEAMRWRRASEIGIPPQSIEIWIRNFLRSERTG
ncbi:MAG: MASE1 domain-containing protein, partial [Verrucomicrobiota bacterium]